MHKHNVTSALQVQNCILDTLTEAQTCIINSSDMQSNICYKDQPSKYGTFRVAKFKGMGVRNKTKGKWLCGCAVLKM